MTEAELLAQPAEAYMNAEQQAFFRDLLLHQRAELQARIEEEFQALRERSQAPAAPDEVGEEPLSAPTPPKKTRKTRASRKRAAGPTLLGDE